MCVLDNYLPEKKTLVAQKLHKVIQIVWHCTLLWSASEMTHITPASRHQYAYYDDYYDYWHERDLT